MHASVLETLSEPLTAVLFLVALAGIAVLPAFHFHQFGEPTRLARECGLSAALVFGLLFAVPAVSGAVRREIESGTAAAQLARAVPRSVFLLGKTAGTLAVFALFVAAAFLETSLSVLSSAAGDVLARGGAAEGHVWGVALAAQTGSVLLALLAAAAANRFFRMRFCVTASCLLALSPVLAWAVVVVFPLGRLSFAFPSTAGLAAVFVVLFAGASGFVALAAAVSAAFGGALAHAFTAGFCVLSFGTAAFAAHAPVIGGALRCFLPDVHVFWMADALAGGGVPDAWSVAGRVAAGFAAAAFWSCAGCALFARKELP